MKLRAPIVPVTLISLLLLAFASVGCDSDSHSGPMNVAKDIPEGVDQFDFTDVKALRSDDDLEDIYDDEEDYLEDWLDKYGMDFDEIDTYTKFGDSTILGGEFDLDDIRDELDYLDYYDDEYKDVEVWKSDGWSDPFIALIGESTVILGSEEDVRDCIKVIMGDDDSLSDDQDFRDIMDRLPSGITVTYSTDEDYRDLEASGVSMKKKDDATLKITGVFKFEDEDAAEDAIDEIEDDVEDDDDIKNIDIDQDGEFVKITAEIDINDAF